MDTDREFVQTVRPFAESLIPLASALCDQPKGPMRAALLGAVTQLLRKCHDAVMVTVRPPTASAAAIEMAGGLGIDIETLRWGREPRDELQPRQKLLHLDHITPIYEIGLKCLDATSASDIQKVLLEHLHAAWITPEENAELNRLKFQSRRPDPRSAYRQAGIVVDPWPA